MEFNTIYYSFKSTIHEIKEDIHSLIHRIRLLRHGSERIVSDYACRNYISFIIDSNDYLNEINHLIIAGNLNSAWEMLKKYLISLMDYPFYETPDHQVFRAYSLMESIILEKQDGLNDSILDFILTHYEFYLDHFNIDFTDLFFEHYQDLCFDYTKKKLRRKQNSRRVTGYPHYE